MRILQKAVLKALAKTKKRPLSVTLDKFRPQEVKKTLVVSSTAIGDALFAVPGIRALKTLLPEAKIDFMVRDKVAGLFANFPLIDDLLVYRGRYKNALGLLSALRKKRYDLCIVFHDSDPCPVEVAHVANIPFIFRIGQKDHKTAHLLTKRIPYDNTKHAIDQRLEVLRHVFRVPLNHPRDLRMELPVNEEELKVFRQRYLHPFKDVTREDHAIMTVAFQFSASGSYKEWPEENFVELGKRLIKNKYRVVLIGGPSDRPRAERLLQAISEGTDGECVLNLAGQIDLKHLPVALKAVDLLVTNDTGPLHVAISVGTRTVSLFVPSNVAGTGPIQDLHLHKVITKPKPCNPCIEKYCKQATCMGLIGVDEVFDQVQNSLAQKRNE